MGGRPRLARGTVAAGVALAPLLLLALVGGGCEIAIGKEAPAFECVQGPAVCPGEQVCDPSSHQCVEPCTVTGCASGTACDTTQGICVAGSSSGGEDGPSSGGETGSGSGGGDGDATTQPDETGPPQETGPGPDTAPCTGTGCPCTGPSSCASQICADSALVPPGLNAVAGNFCTKPCCSSNDCDPGTVCFAIGGNSAVAANLCVEAAWLQRTAGVGTGLGGASCSQGRDCRSGLCANQVCADTCCSTAASNSECSDGDECTFGTFPGVASFDKNYVAMCGHGGSRANGQSCQQDSDCQSWLCGGSQGCSNACRSSADCSSIGEACAYVTPNSEPTATVAACFSGGIGNNPGTTPQGGSCGQDSDCQSLFCDSNSHECTDVCFADSDCTKSGWRCRPESLILQGGGKLDVLACGP